MSRRLTRSFWLITRRGRRCFLWWSKWASWSRVRVIFRRSFWRRRRRVRGRSVIMNRGGWSCSRWSRSWWRVLCFWMRRRTCWNLWVARRISFVWWSVSASSCRSRLLRVVVNGSRRSRNWIFAWRRVRRRMRSWIRGVHSCRRSVEYCRKRVKSRRRIRSCRTRISSWLRRMSNWISRKNN